MHNSRGIGFNFAFISLILLVNIEDILTLERLHVNCEQKNNCALRETEVTLRCIYLNRDIKTVFWFSHKQRKNWRNRDEPEDIALDFDYSGRVKQHITNYQSELTIRDVREKDSVEYQLMFIMKDGVKHFSSVTVNLTVTVLQLKIQSTEKRDHRVLTCQASCPLAQNPLYVWKKDGQYIQNVYTESLSVSSSEYAAYYCLTPDHKISSAPVCLSERCWHVTYVARRVCALVGSTVDIHSSYSHPTGYTVVNTFWHSRHERFIDLREEHQFAGRVEYVSNALRIKDVKMSDSGEYQFRIIANTPYSGSPGVILIVTDTQVTISPAVVSDGEKVILSCSTECTLDKSMTISWYKNGQPVIDGFTILNKLYLDSVNNDELKEYSCTVIDNTEKPAKSVVPYFLIVFVVQVLIIGAVWVWFFLKIFFLSKYQNNDKNEEIQMSHMSACTSEVSPTEPVA